MWFASEPIEPSTRETERKARCSSSWNLLSLLTSGYQAGVYTAYILDVRIQKELARSKGYSFDR
eukprot:scaffold670_cov58-Attheya_sp.AAC.2